MGKSSIGLHVIPFVQRIRDEEPLKCREDLIAKQEQLIEELEPDPNWSCLWILHDRLRHKAWNYWSEEKGEYYPAVMLVAKVNCIVK